MDANPAFEPRQGIVGSHRWNKKHCAKGEHRNEQTFFHDSTSMFIFLSTSAALRLFRSRTLLIAI
jgi:hypothetical protein